MKHPSILPGLLLLVALVGCGGGGDTGAIPEQKNDLRPTVQSIGEKSPPVGGQDPAPRSLPPAPSAPLPPLPAPPASKPIAPRATPAAARPLGDAPNAVSPEPETRGAGIVSEAERNPMEIAPEANPAEAAREVVALPGETEEQAPPAAAPSRPDSIAIKAVEAPVEKDREEAESMEVRASLAVVRAEPLVEVEVEVLETAEITEITELPDGRSAETAEASATETTSRAGEGSARRDPPPSAQPEAQAGVPLEKEVREGSVWCPFTLDTASDVRLELSGPSSTSRTLTLYHGKTRLAHLLQLLPANLVYRNLPPGQFLLQLHPAMGEENDWTVTLSANEVGKGIDPYPDDQSPAGASPIGSGEEQEHSIFPAGDVDWYAFSLERAADVEFQVRGPAAGGSMAITLFDADGKREIAHAVGPVPRALSRRNLSPGRYLVKVSAFRRDLVIGSYLAALTTTEIDSVADPFPDDTPESAPLIAPGVPMQRSLLPAGDVDWFHFRLPRAAEAEFTVTAPEGAGIRLTLFAREPLRELTFTVGPPPRMLSRNLPSGEYLVRVAAVGPNQVLGAYSAHLRLLPSVNEPYPLPEPTAAGFFQRNIVPPLQRSVAILKNVFLWLWPFLDEREA